MRSLGALLSGREPQEVPSTAQHEVELRAQQRMAALARGELLLGERQEDIDRVEARLTALEQGGGITITTVLDDREDRGGGGGDLEALGGRGGDGAQGYVAGVQERMGAVSSSRRVQSGATFAQSSPTFAEAGFSRQLPSPSAGSVGPPAHTQMVELDARGAAGSLTRPQVSVALNRRQLSAGSESLLSEAPSSPVRTSPLRQQEREQVTLRRELSELQSQLRLRQQEQGGRLAGAEGSLVAVVGAEPRPAAAVMPADEAGSGGAGEPTGASGRGGA